MVRLTDLFGNIVTKSGYLLTAAIQSGTGSVSNNTATTDSNGVATFTNLSITGSGAFTLLVDGALLSSVTANVTVVSTASQFAILAMPTTGTDNVAFSTQPQLRLLDALGNNVLQAGVVVTASVFTGNGTLIGTVTATTDANGIATFSNLDIDDLDL